MSTKVRSNSINLDKIFNIDSLLFKPEIHKPKKISKSKVKVTYFRNLWTSIVAECGSMSEGKKIEDTQIKYHMGRMVNMLICEDRNLPNNLANCGDCMEYFLNKNCLKQLVDSSIKKIPPEGLIEATVEFYSNLCSLLNENFLTKQAVYKPLLILLKYCYAHRNITQLYEKTIIELLYNICQKINIHPQLLNIFIFESSDSDYYECILFEYLKQFIFSYGQTGDMARTSMKYLFTHPFDIFLKYIDFIHFPEQLIDDLSATFNELPLNLKEISPEGNAKIYQFKALFSLTESIIMDCSIQPIRNSIMFNLRERFLKKTFINIYVESYHTPETLEAISTYFFYMLSKIVCIDFSSCFVTFIFENFTFVKSTEETETNLFNLIMDHTLTHDRTTSLATIHMLIISCLLKQHYRYTVSYLIPNIRTKSSEKIENDVTHHGEDTTPNVSHDKVQFMRNEVDRYIDLYNKIRKDFGNDIAGVSNQYQEYIFDVNTNLDIQLTGLNFNELNRNYPENAIQNILDESDQIKAIKLLDQEKIFSQLFSLLKTFFNNSPEFNLALTDAISQLLTAPETYLFVYLVNRDMVDDDHHDSLYTVFNWIIEQRQNLLETYQEELFKSTTAAPEQQDLMSQFNRNSRYLLEFIKEVTVTIFEIQLKSEIFENY